MLKPGLRQNVFYLIKKSVKILQAYHYMKKNENLPTELEKFMICFKANEDCILSSARYQLEKQRLLKTRKPCQLPMEQDLCDIHRHVIDRIQNLVSEYQFWTSHSFVELCNIVCTRLTLLNARRGGETSRLEINVWKEAENDGWIDQQRLNNLSVADKILVESLKITYMAGI